MPINYVLSVDPGYSTGIALLGYDEKTPAWLEEAWQFSGGVDGFKRWWQNHAEYGYGNLEGWNLGGVRASAYWNVEDGLITRIAEKFTPRPNEKFGLTLRSVEPLRLEGILVWEGFLPDYDPKVKEWRQPALQYIAGGKDKAEKKKRLHKMLKDTDYYVTGSTVNAPDADDARSAIGHGLGYIIREVKHKPTFEVLAEWSESNGS